MTKMEQRLRDLCMNNSEYETKYHQYENVVRIFVDKLRIVPVYFPHFSKHDSSHSQNIIKYIGMLLGEQRINKLSVSDLLVFLLSCYAHDIGMSLRYESIHDVMGGDHLKRILDSYTDSVQEDLAMAAERLLQFRNCDETEVEGNIEQNYGALDIYKDVLQIIEEEFRKNHPKRSSELIEKDEKLNDLLGTRINRILSEVCEAHGKEIEGIMNLPWESVGIFDDYIHPRLLAAMLCIGDLLDMDTDRFDQVYVNAATGMPELSKIHQKKHQSVRNFLVKNSIIEISTDCDEMNVYRATRDWITWLKQACEFVATEWNQISPEEFGNAPYINKAETLLNGAEKWGCFADTKFHISDDYALELLKGSGIYKDKFVFMREIIQNAIDATVKRIYNDLILKYGSTISEKDCLKYLTDGTVALEDYAIKGKIFIKNKKVVVELADQGVGIRTSDIERIAGLKGRSHTESKDIAKFPLWLKPSGIFSIGLQSIFLVANSFEIITRTSDELPKKIVFEESSRGNGYITVSDYNQNISQGSILRIEINENKISQYDMSVNNYYYKIVPKYKLIYQAIASAKYNQEKETMPVFEVRRQLQDYIPVEMKGQDDEIVLVKYDSIFKKIPYNRDNHLWIEINTDSIDYSYFDIEKACAFYACFSLANNSDHIYRKHSYKRSYKYGQTIYYRNVFVKDDAFHSSRKNCISSLDFRINLMSEDADRILNLGRDDIREEYKPILSDLLDFEIKTMIEHIVDTLLNEHKNIGDLIMLIYQYACQFEYKQELLWVEYSDILNQIRIGNYYSVLTNEHKEFTEDTTYFDKKANGEHSIDKEERTFESTDNPPEQIVKLSELKNNDILFLEELEKDEKIIPEKYFKNLKETEKYYQLHPKNGNTHILDHRLVQEYLGILNGKKYHVYKTNPFFRGNGAIVVLDDFFRCIEFLNIIMGNLRCVHPTKKFEMLQTPIFGRLYYITDYSYHIMRVEMEMNETIKEKMNQDIISDGFIRNCVDKYSNDIFESTEFMKNVEYIYQYNSYMYTGITLVEIEKKYKEFIRELLGFLDDEELKKYSSHLKISNNNSISLKNSLIHFQEEDYSYYISI
ncbi:MAG: hypothetical protein K1W19_18400 [Lachnospiraceae bacterium]